MRRAIARRGSLEEDERVSFRFISQRAASFRRRRTVSSAAYISVLFSRCSTSTSSPTSARSTLTSCTTPSSTSASLASCHVSARVSSLSHSCVVVSHVCVFVVAFTVSIPCTGETTGIASMYLSLAIRHRSGQPIPGSPLKLHIRKRCIAFCECRSPLTPASHASRNQMS